MYRNELGKPEVLESVREAERRLMAKNLDHEYAPVPGVAEFVNHAQRFAFGADSIARKEGRIASVQSVCDFFFVFFGFSFRMVLLFVMIVIVAAAACVSLWRDVTSRSHGSRDCFFLSTAPANPQLSGTGGLRLASEFLQKFMPKVDVFSPT